ncbi:MAG TPA: hypothetical protein VMU18_06460 [Rhodoblastus sp.]|nr:hypothetical protein [Rhodoblastus sp.]
MFTYIPKSLVQAQIIDGPWTLHEENSFFQHDANGIVPPSSQTAPPYVGTGVPYANYCDKRGVVAKNHGASVMQPFYFPFVRSRLGQLEGYFDYRPRNEQEATVAAISNDWGATWHFMGQALGLNPYCPWDPTDPDNQNVSVKGVQTAYGSDAANAADNGLGHAFVMRVKGKQHIYHLNRADGHIDSDQLVVHDLPRIEALRLLPAYGYVSPLGSGGYPTLEPTAKATQGLHNPDAILGSVELGTSTTILYIDKLGNGDTTLPSNQQCPKTPAFALTNLDAGKARKANHDLITIRVATTTDGVTFTDVGAATGLMDATTVALNGIRYLGSGSLLRLSDGRYGMFFGAGSCLDNDSDGFHFVGYAETTNRVTSAADLLSWKVIYDLDHPLLSTDTVVDDTVTPNRAYPLTAPVVNVHGADVITAAQVAPWVAPTPASPIVTPVGGYNSNFFSGRVYDPQAVYTDEKTITIVFAGYNTPQPSGNLGDYRSIGRVQLRVPAGYFAPY